MGLVEHIAKGKILSTIRSQKVKDAILNIVGQVDEILDEVVGDKGSQEIRTEISNLLMLASEKINEEEKKA